MGTLVSKRIKLPKDKAKALSLLAEARLYVILTSHLSKRPVLETAQLALEGGADILQLREKDMPDGEFLRLALELRELTTRMGRLFIVNDRPYIALESGADGVHLGQGDMSISEARDLLGANFLIGLSAHSLEQARQAHLQGADYIGIGPIFPTQTKDAGQPIGTEVLRSLNNFPIPYFAIGGINLTNLAEVTKAGAGRVAVCSAVISQEDVLNVARKFSCQLSVFSCQSSIVADNRQLTTDH
jgi:thiamine-phosphate pyrophosphorylase